MVRSYQNSSLSLSVLALFVLLALPAHGEPVSGELCVEGEGKAIGDMHDLVAARKSALDDAFRHTLEKALIAVLPPSSTSNVVEEATNSLFPRYAAYLVRYRILSEIPGPQSYSVSVQAIYSLQQLKQDLYRTGILKPDGSSQERTLILRMHNVSSFSCYNAFAHGLAAQIPAVVYCVPQEIYGKEVTFVVRCRMEAKALAEALQSWNAEDCRVRVLHVDDESLEIDMRTPQD